MILEKDNNTVFLSPKLAEDSPLTYEGVIGVLARYGVPYHLLEGTKALWCRDYMPVQVAEDRFLRYNYDPDYLKTPRWRDSRSDNREVCRLNGIDYDDTLGDIVIDGGNVVHGVHKVVLTSKVFEENPSYTVRELSAILENAFDAELIVLPWDSNEIYGHTDGILRLVDDDTVVMTNYRQIDYDMAKRLLHCLQPHFKTIHELKYDVKRSSKYNWAYINWLQTDKVIIVPGFGIAEDQQVMKQLSAYLLDYQNKIEMINARDLVMHGGGLNCASWTVKS